MAANLSAFEIESVLRDLLLKLNSSTPFYFFVSYLFPHPASSSTLNCCVHSSIIILLITIHETPKWPLMRTRTRTILLRNLIVKMSAKTTQCGIQMNTLKNSKAHSRDPNHLGSIYSFENRMTSINDEILLLAAYERASLALRLTDLTAYGIMDMDTALYKAKRLDNKLDGLINDANGFQSRAKVES
jgi:hypothetical protein